MADIRFEGNEIETNTIKPSQVWQVTHDGAGNVLPHRYRSFISFSFGGKYIEEFDLIAYCSGNTMAKNGYADFEDLTTSYDIMDGQYYHGTHYRPNTLSVNLVTDGIDEKKLTEFLNWFAGGQTRELILAEHPNRAIMARVQAPPALEVLPFEKAITLEIGGVEYTSSTTLYKGNINLTFVADMPFWYAKQNVLIYNAKNQGIFSSAKLLATNDLFKEALKVVYEDGIPINSMVQDTMHFGTNQYASNDDSTPYTKIAGPIDESHPTVMPTNWALIKDLPGYFIEVVNGTNEYWYGAKADGVDANDIEYIGRIAGAVMVAENTNLSGPIIADSSVYQLFYAGTAPSPATISFKVNLEPLGDSGYIDCIANTYAKDSSNHEYSTITVTSVHTKKFDFTTPNIITSWNKAYKLLNDIQVRSSTTVNGETVVSGTNWNDLVETLRDQIRHPAVRTFAIQLINYMQSHNDGNVYLQDGIFTQDGQDFSIDMLKLFFQKYDVTTQQWSYPNASFTFNAETGLAQGQFYYWKETSSSSNIINFLVNIEDKTSSQVNARFKLHTEDVGDMLRSNWLFLEDHNQLVNNRYVKAWASDAPQNAHKVVHNAPGALIDLKFEYKNMYL